MGELESWKSGRKERVRQHVESLKVASDLAEFIPEQCEDCMPLRYIKLPEIALAMLKDEPTVGHDEARNRAILAIRRHTDNCHGSQYPIGIADARPDCPAQQAGDASHWVE